MSFDLGDYLDASGDYANVVASGILAVGSHDVVVNLSATDRSLVILLNNIADPVTVTVTGGVTGIQYTSNAISATLSVGLITVPVYGAIDNTVTVNFNTNLPAGGGYWIVATPDIQINGDQQAPFYVLNPPLTPINTSVVDKDSVGGVTTALNNNNGQAVAAPPAGVRPVVDMVSFTGGTTAGDFQLRVGSNVGPVLLWQAISATAAANLPISGPIYGASGQAIWQAWTGVGASRFTLAYHLEYVGL